MKKPINREHIAGRVYNHELAVKVTGEGSKHPGTTYIGGTLDVATDEEGLNVVTVHFTYVTEVTAKGNKNNTFTALKNIIDNGKTIVLDGFENATMVKIDTALALNDFYSNRNGAEELVSTKRNNGGFVTIVNTLEEESTRNNFEFDMLINGVRLVEADPERHIDNDYLIVKGAIFDFRKAILPVELIVKNEGGIKYFESLEPSSSNLVFTKVWGKIQSQTIVDRREEESAFGEAAIKEYTRNVREWVITGTSRPEAVYEIGDEATGITEEEIKKAMTDREVYLAEQKRRQEEYQASRNTATSVNAGSSTVSAAAGGFNF